MNKQLEQVLAIVIKQRTGTFHESFAAVKNLAADYPLEELADRLVADTPHTVPWEVVADMLEMLIWTTSDNGASIRRTAERWLIEAKDVRMAEIALQLDVYPFETKEEMARVLANVARLFPEVAEQCRSLVEQRATAFA